MKPPSARDLFARALDLDPDDRDSFLAEECGVNAELRLEVQRLLVDSEKAQSFFSDEDGATIGMEEFDDTFTEAEGDVVGPYTLRQQIGEGGFGTVWMAEQSVPISRMVALKVIKAGMDTKQVLARFEAERQAVAMMDHPNIAKVLDAGATPAGRPYFAMELVKGMPITQFCDQQKFGPRRRLELFKDVCAAVQHAHQKGIIHRDLKPSNIMVTLAADVPVVKVIDFGIAKATQNKLTEKTLFTRFEQFLGTPVYMSPEQAAMSAIDIDTRSDIYSLGVLLYELLAGAPPFDQKSLLSAGYDEMRRIIAEDEPPMPSTRCTQTNTSTGSKPNKFHISATALKGELDWIVMKAIEKDRTRRYGTANSFAADIGRYLDDKPVEAAAPSSSYKFKKFARRNKAAFSVATAMAVLLLAGIATTSWQAIRATAESVRATKAEKKATTENKRATAESERATAALGDAEASSKFLFAMFAISKPGEEKGNVTAEDVLNRAAEQMGAATMPPNRRAGLQSSLGSTYYALGLYDKAIPLQEKARDYHLATSGSEHSATLSAMANLAMSYFKADRRNEAFKLLEEVLILHRKVLGPGHPDTLKTTLNLAISCYDAGHRRDEALKLMEKVLSLSPKEFSPEYPNTFKSTTKLANSYRATHRWDDALKLLEEVLALHRKVLGPGHPDTLKATLNLAISCYDAGHRRDEALKLMEKVLSLSPKEFSPKYPNTFRSMTKLANSYRNPTRLEEAFPLLEEVLGLHRKVLGLDHPDTLRAMTNLADFYRDFRRWDETIKLFEEMLPELRMELGPEHPNTLRAIRYLTTSYQRVGRLDEAIKLSEELLPLSRKVLGPECHDTLEAMSTLASSYRIAGRRDDAIKIQENVLTLSRQALGLEHRKTLEAMGTLANSYVAASRLDEAIKLMEERVRLLLLRKVHGSGRRNTLNAMASLAGSYQAAGRLDEALKMQEEVLALQRRASHWQYSNKTTLITNLATSYHDVGRWDEAIKLYEPLLPSLRNVIRSVFWDPNSHKDYRSEMVRFLGSMTNLATSYYHVGRRDEALELQEEVLELCPRVLDPEHPETLNAMTKLAISYQSADRIEEAVALEEKALDLKRKHLPERDPKTIESMDNLATCYEKADRRVDAQRLRDGLAKIKPDAAKATPPSTE